MAVPQVLFGLIVLLSAGEALGGSTGAPNPDHGKNLAASLCSNCHLVGNEQQQANADVPSFQEIANGGGSALKPWVQTPAQQHNSSPTVSAAVQ